MKMLKPCPFCNGVNVHAVIYNACYEKDAFPEVRILCTICNAMIKYGDPDLNLAIENAVNTWNKRGGK